MILFGYIKYDEQIICTTDIYIDEDLKLKMSLRLFSDIHILVNVIGLEFYSQQ